LDKPTLLDQASSMPFTAAEIATRLGGEVVGDGSVILTGFAPAESAQQGDLTFAENAAYFARAESSAARAILVGRGFSSQTKVLIRVPDARVAFAKVLPLFFPEPVVTPGVHPTALVAASARVDPTAFVGPFCMIGKRTTIGAKSVLDAMVYVGDDCRLGSMVRLFPQVTLYARTEIGDRVRVHAGTVIGSDGYGYVQDRGVHQKVPQVGNVIIQEDVEIGAGVTIDRGALGSTIIGRGTKIDNLVQIAHNVIVGEHCLLVSQVGIAGSTRIGHHVTIAGQAGVAGHLKIGDGAVIAAKSGVMTDIPAGEHWAGAPARRGVRMKKQWVALEHLPDLLKRVAAIERQLGLGAGDTKNEPPGETGP